MKRLFALFLTCASTLALAACGDSGKSLLSTGSILGGKEVNTAAPVPGKIDPLARPIQVGWVSARATKCGFYFDPAKLKQQYLAAEAATGLPLDQLRKLELSYEYSRNSTAKKITKRDGYCSDVRTRAIRKDLQRHLAGDFTPTPRPKKKDGGGAFSWLYDEFDNTPDKFDADALRQPTDNQ